jgi:hypothetical protein
MSGTLALLCLALVAACSSPTAAGDRRTLAPGSWGGNHVALEVTSSGGTVEFDCAHGTITEPIALDDDGRFDAAGTYVREHGGPVREGEEDARPARYGGRVQGQTMTLTITVAGESVGPFELERGRTPRITKCL